MPPLIKYGSPVVSVSAASMVPKPSGSPLGSASIRLLSAAAWTISVRSTSPSPAVGGASSVTGTSVEKGIVGVASTMTGASVATGSCVVTGSSVGGKTSGVSAGGGVVSSANTLIGNISDNINENKTTIDKTVSFFVFCIVVSPSQLLIKAIGLGLVGTISLFQSVSLTERDFIVTNLSIL